MTLALVLVGCGSDEPGGSGGDTSNESPSQSPSGSLSPTPVLPDPTPTIEAATGPQLDVEGLRVRVPENWRQTYDTLFSDAGQGPRGTVLLTVFATDQLSLAASMKKFWEKRKPPTGFEPQDSTVMGGLTAYYYTSRPNDFDVDHVVGLWDSGYVVKVSVTLSRDIPATRQREILDSVVASYERKS